METPTHSLQDKYMITNALGQEIHFTAELLAWNNLFLILLTIAALAVLVNRLKPDDNKHNITIKLMYGGLAIMSLAGLLYPIEFGLIGVNVIGTFMLVIDFFKHNKNKDYDNRKQGN